MYKDKDKQSETQQWDDLEKALEKSGLDSLE